MNKNCQEVQDEQIKNLREGKLSIKVENTRKLMSDFSRAVEVGGRIVLGRRFFKDYDHLISYLIGKYFTKEEVKKKC